MSKNYFYDPNETRSHNCLHNYVIGVRRCGKTYGCLKDCINRFLTRGEQFIYLRRYKTELKEFDKILDPLIDNEEFKGHELEVKNKEIYVDDEIAGFGRALSTGKIQKGTNMTQVQTIIFDEFLIEKGVYHYLQDETGTFNDFLISVSSYRDVTTFYLANAISIANPYFLKYDLRLPYGSKYFKRGERLVQMEAEPAFIEHVKNTRLGKDLLENDPVYSAYAINNEFLLDNDNFIAKKTGNCYFIIALKYGDDILGFYQNLETGIVYASYDYDPYTRGFIAVTTHEHNINTILLKAIKTKYPFRGLIDAYNRGLMRFESQRIKSQVLEVFKTCMMI